MTMVPLINIYGQNTDRLPVCLFLAICEMYKKQQKSIRITLRASINDRSVKTAKFYLHLLDSGHCMIQKNAAGNVNIPNSFNAL